MKEQPWKTFLNWSAVCMFFGMPLLVLLIQLAALQFPNWLSQQLPQAEFKYLYEFQRALAILVFGLAGMNTWEHVKNGNQQRKEKNENRHSTDH